MVPDKRPKKGEKKKKRRKEEKRKGIKKTDGDFKEW